MLKHELSSSLNQSFLEPTPTLTPTPTPTPLTSFFYVATAAAAAAIAVAAPTCEEAAKVSWLSVVVGGALGCRLKPSTKRGGRAEGMRSEGLHRSSWSLASGSQRMTGQQSGRQCWWMSP